MAEASFVGLAQNVALLLALVVIFDIVIQGRDISRFSYLKFFTGIMVGGIGLVVMMTPWVLEPGVVFDTRSILLGISGLFFGTLPTIVAMIMTALFRIYQGGDGALTGVLVILVTGSLGIAWRHLRKKPLIKSNLFELYVFGIVLHIVMLALMLTMPRDIVFQVLGSVSLPVMILYPLGTALLGFLFRNRLQREMSKNELKLLNYRLRDTQRLAKVGGWEWDVKNNTLFLTDEVLEIFGFDQGYKNLLPDDFFEETLRLLSPESVQEYRILFDRLVQQGEPYDEEFEITTSDGNKKWLRTRAEAVYEKKNLIRIVGNIIDITERKIADLALQTEKIRLALIIEGTDAGTWEWEVQTGQVIFNERWASMVGYTLDELQPITIETWKMLTHPDDLVRSSNLLEMHFSGEIGYYENEIRMRHKDGHWVWMLDRGKVSAWDEDGKPKWMQGTHQDISVRKEAESALRESEIRYRKLIAIAPVGIFVHAEDEIVFINPTGAKMLGAESKDQILGKSIYDFIYEEDIAEARLRIEKLLADEEVRYPKTTRYIKFNGTVMNVEVMATKLTYYGKPAVQIIISDITDRKRAEEKIQQDQKVLRNLLEEAEHSRKVLLSLLEDQKEAEDKIRKLNLDLERRVRERTAELEASNKELEAFAYSVSHDLRAPLRGIDGFSKILEEDYSDHLDNEGLRLLGIVRSSTKKMDQLITDILALSRVSRSQLRPMELDMKSLASSIYQEMMIEDVSNEFKFDISEMPSGWGDPILMRQVWVNLISNAIKYTKPKPEKKIKIQGYEQDGHCVYSIEDSGVGFNPKYIDKLFGLFQRLHRDSEFEGTGIGLAIVQRIISRHSGEVWAESQENEGATFHFSIPKRKETNA